MGKLEIIELARQVARRTPTASLVQGWRRRQARRLLLSSLRPSDVFIVGHPKSGNTWLSYMLAIAINGDEDGRINLANLGEYVVPVHENDPSVAEHAQRGSPRLFRNERPLWPADLPRTIYLVRDPRAVLVSYYYHVLAEGGEYFSLDAFVDAYLYGSFFPRLQRWDVHVHGWLERAELQTVLFIRYEEMLQDRASALDRSLRFVGVEPAVENVDLALERGSFNAMRQAECHHGVPAFSSPAVVHGRPTGNSSVCLESVAAVVEELYFIRRGEADSWRDELSASSQRRIEEEFGPVMRRLGYLL